MIYNKLFHIKITKNEFSQTMLYSELIVRLIVLKILTLLTMVAESIVFESLTITVKCTIITGLEFKNMVQFVISAGDQFPSLLHCLPISTPERKLGCNSEQG